MDVTEKTPAPNHDADRERAQRAGGGGGRKEGEEPDGRNTQQGNKLAETITYSDRPGGGVLLAGRRCDPRRGPPCPRWMASLSGLN